MRPSAAISSGLACCLDRRSHEVHLAEFLIEKLFPLLRRLQRKVQIGPVSHVLHHHIEADFHDARAEIFRERARFECNRSNPRHPLNRCQKVAWPLKLPLPLQHPLHHLTDFDYPRVFGSPKPSEPPGSPGGHADQADQPAREHEPSPLSFLVVSHEKASCWDICESTHVSKHTHICGREDSLNLAGFSSTLGRRQGHCSQMGRPLWPEFMIPGIVHSV